MSNMARVFFGKILHSYEILALFDFVFTLLRKMQRSGTIKTTDYCVELCEYTAFNTTILMQNRRQKEGIFLNENVENLKQPSDPVFQKLAKRAAVVAQKISPETVEGILDLMEYTRRKIGLSMSDFAALLQITSSRYYHMQQTRKTVNVLVLLRFCAIFGYDLESVCHPLSTVSDKHMMEMASWMGMLPPSVLKAIAQTVDNSLEMTGTEKRLFKQAMDAFIQAKNEYAADL